MQSQPAPKLESHITLPSAVRDIIIGMSDGLTVPFAIAAGLASAAATDSTIIIAAVLAEIAAGSISMGLGGFLAANTEAEHFAIERAREEREVEAVPEIEEKEVADVLVGYGLTRDEGMAVANSLRQRKEDWINFMMKFELGLETPDRLQAVKSAATVAGAYIVGGFIPLSPYLFIHSVQDAFLCSIGVTALALLVFGYLRGHAIGARPLYSMLQTMLVGGVAATAAFLIAKLVP